MRNLLQETSKILLQHNLDLSNIMYVTNGVEYCTASDFLRLAANIEYDEANGITDIDPCLKIVGSTFRLVRKLIDNEEKWVYLTKDELPKIYNKDLKLQSTTDDKIDPMFRRCY